MKKISLLTTAMMLSASAFAQTTLWDGESLELGSQGNCWDDGHPTVVENPDKNGINNSEKCLHFSMTEDSKVVKIPFRDWIQPSMDGSRRVSLMIKKGTNENLQIELSDPTDGSNGYWEKVAAWYGGDGEWQKVVFDYSTNPAFDCPGVISITAQTGMVEGAVDVYIDNVVIEPATRTNGLLLSEIADGSLTGHVELGGAWMKGDCSNTDGDWIRNDYNDFEALAAKLAPTATSVDMRGTVLKDAYNAFGGINPNIIVYADAMVDGDNVVVEGNAANVTLDTNYPFCIPAPHGFNAANVTLRRALTAGYNTLYVPFYVSAEDLGAESLATFDRVEANGWGMLATFEPAEYAEANTPLLVNMAEGRDELTFSNKFLAELGDETSLSPFKGVYEPLANGGWIVENNQFRQLADGETMGAFGAYMAVKGISTLDFEIATGIDSPRIADNGEAKSKVYTLGGQQINGNAGNMAKGIYIVNGKKIVVK